MGKFQSSKVFDGFSTVFRQWKATTTHCRFVHGYGISFKVYFEGDLDERNWVWDFGGMKRAKTKIDGKSPKEWMDYMFDHTLVIAEEDRALSVQISGTSGGDSTAGLLDVLAGAYTDIGLIPTPLQTDILLSEIPDTVRPIPTSMFVNFTDGTATFSSSETIDVTPTSNINLSQVELSGQHNPSVPVTFGFSTIVAKDGTTVTFSGNVSAAGGTFGNVTVGLSDNQTVTTSSGKLVLDAATNEVEINADIDHNGALNTSGNLVCGGTGTFSGDVIAFSSSDLTMKENVSPIDNALDMVSSLTGNTFDWKSNAGIWGLEGGDTGIIAQEVEKLKLPGLTKTRGDGTIGVRYDRLIPVLIEAIKELKSEINKLKK